MVILLTIYFWVVLAWVVLSWIPVSSVHPLGRLANAIDPLVRPVITPIRRVIPGLRMGGALLDLSPIILLLAIQILIGLFD